jgi:hypothetical protein
MPGSVEFCEKFTQNCLLVMFWEIAAVVRPLEWLEVKDERFSNSVFHDFYNGAGDCFSKNIEEAGRPQSG